MKEKSEPRSLGSLLLHISMAATLMAVLSITFFYYILPVITNKDSSVTVPDLTGMNLEEVEKVLGKRDLKYEVTDPSYAPAEEPQAVLKQYPPPLAKVKINRKIALTLNARTPPSIVFPDLRGTTFEFARQQLSALDLKIGNVEYRPDFAHNSVLEVSIAGKNITGGDRIYKGSTVDFTIGDATHAE